MNSFVSASLCLMVLTAGKTALAEDIPPGCSKNPYNTKAYQTGIYQGKCLVQRAWRATSSCDNLEAFSDIVTKNVKSSAPTGATEYSVCRYTGLYDGVLQELDSVWTGCEGQCCQEGSVIGELAADMYCQLSILLGGLADPNDFVRRPVFFCGFAFQVCCDATFLSSSLIYQGPDSTGQMTQCTPYTEPPFIEIWNNTRELQCAYEPPPPTLPAESELR